MQLQNSFFPAFISLKNRKILLVGGGKIALDKLEKLLLFSQNIKIVAKDFSDEFLEISKKNSLKVLKREYKDEDLNSCDIVIIAVDSSHLHEDIYNKTRDLRVLVNSVDNINYCDFIFPSFIKDGDLTIAISTNGASPAVSKYLKRYIQKLLPKDLKEFMNELKKLREDLPKGKARMQILQNKAKEFFKL